MLAPRKLCCFRGLAGVIFGRFRICEVHMKAFASVLAVLLMLSSTSLAQTAPVEPATPVQETAPTRQAAPTQAVPAQQADPTQAAPGGEFAKPEAAKPEAARPEAETRAPAPSPSPAASTPSTEAAAASPDAVLATPSAPPSAPLFAPGAKLFLEPMNGFEQLLSHAILKKKVPVVLVNERAQADFVMSGGVHLKDPGWLKGMVMDTRGKGNVSIKDARTGNEVF